MSCSPQFELRHQARLLNFLQLPSSCLKSSPQQSPRRSVSENNAELAQLSPIPLCPRLRTSNFVIRCASYASCSRRAAHREVTTVAQCTKIATNEQRGAGTSQCDTLRFSSDHSMYLATQTLCPSRHMWSVRGVSWSEVATVPKRKSHRGLDLDLSLNSEVNIRKGWKEHGGTK